MQNDMEKILDLLSKSKFRSGFHLKGADKEYCLAKGIATIELHARDFVSKRLAPAFPKNDGKQTPMRSHPVFIAQHATATCCRECLFKWHKIEKVKPLSDKDFEFVVSLIMAWIERELGK